jgi:hypothetical protein
VSPELEAEKLVSCANTATAPAVQLESEENDEDYSPMKQFLRRLCNYSVPDDDPEAEWRKPMEIFTELPTPEELPYYYEVIPVDSARDVVTIEKKIEVSRVVRYIRMHTLV